MSSLFNLLLLPPAILMIISDIKHRRIHLYWLILFFIIALAVSIIENKLYVIGINILLNIGLIVYWTIAWIIYILIRYRVWTNPLSRHIGIGDILFFVAVTPLFALKEYLYFMIMAMTFSLVWWCVTLLFKQKNKTIPLVATSGMVLIVYIIVKTCLNLNLIIG